MNRNLLCLIAAVALGCGDRDPDLERSIEWLDPQLALGDQLLLVDKARPRALLIDVGQEPLSDNPHSAPLPHDPRFAWKRNGHDEALILCMGRRASATQEAEPASLAVVQPDARVRTYELGSNPFDSLSQAEDGRFALLFKKGSAERLLDNPNEIAIVDLDKAPGEDGAVTLRTLRSFGDSPLAVSFSPPMNIVGETRRLAVVLSEANVTLIDLDHLDRVETTVALSSDDGREIEPTQVLFNPDAPEIYVRGQSSDDVFVFNLGERPAGEADEDEQEHNDFRPFIDQLGVGGRPSDMALYMTDSGARLLVLANETQAAVVEASSSQVTTVQLPHPADRSLVFFATSPRDRELAQRALLYREHGDVLMFLDLEDLEARGNRNLQVLSLSAPIAEVIPMLEEQRVLILHDEANVSLLDLAGRTVSPITSNTRLEHALFDPERKALWVGPAGQPFVGLLHLSTGETPEVLLDENVASLVPMFEAGHVVVLHDSAVGHLTVLDAEAPSRESARSLRGFLVADLLEGGL